MGKKTELQSLADITKKKSTFIGITVLFAFFFLVFLFSAVSNAGGEDGLRHIILSCLLAVMYILVLNGYLSTHRARVAVLAITLFLGVSTTILIAHLADTYPAVEEDNSIYVVLSLLFWSIPAVSISLGMIKRKYFPKKGRDTELSPLYINDDATAIKIPLEHSVLADRISFLLDENNIKYNVIFPSGDIYPNRPMIIINLSGADADLIGLIHQEAQRYPNKP